MKVTLDLTRLLQEGKITQQEHDKLVQFSKRDTKSHAFSVIMVLAIISLVAGVVGLFPEFFRSMGNTLLQLFGARGLHFFAVILTGTGALLIGSGFLATLCAFTALTFIGNAGTFYMHASYFVFIEEPGTTVLIFSVLAWISFFVSKKLNLKQGRAVLIFSRACIFIVNLAFWIGSLWGDEKGYLKMPDLAFGITWAIALLAIGIWAALNDRRWVVNTAAVFGSIHFYTQWFERLGASPGSLVCAGAIALAILYGIRSYNQSFVKSRVA